MDLCKLFVNLLYFAFINGFVIKDNNDKLEISDEADIIDRPKNVEANHNPANVFHGVYTDCFFHLSYTCIQKKTLLYLKELNTLNEISVIGDYIKFVKLNNSEHITGGEDPTSKMEESSDQLAYMIDKAVDNFFDNHLIRFSALGKDVLVPNKVDEFVGRKKRKGGGGGGHGGGDDGGKKKMMMMAMMCMKMKLMMMLPAMMGMMGMMSFKGMMFSMMSFMISKMMLLMKILEKKGGGFGGGGGDGGWATGGGGGGGAWMPTGQDYGAGGGGGYDANGQWQSRSIIEDSKEIHKTPEDTPIIAYAKPITYSNTNDVKPLSVLKNINNELTRLNYENKPKSRQKRSIMDVLQNAYTYWTNRVLGIGKYKRFNHYPKYKVINGVKYVYYPFRGVKVKTPKELQPNVNEIKPTVIDDFNKGEIMVGAVESRMSRKKFHKVKDNVNETIDMVGDDPWQ